jgi:glycosyltransferase involved in cell wall biosynthesis
MISVVIPLYNKEDYIAKAMQSVLAQTFRSFELIVVNDGSTDNSRSVAESFKDNRIQILNQANKGVSEARNYGVDKATFQWVAFLDADDWWAPEFLEHLVEAIQQYPHEHIFASGRSKVFEDRIERYKNIYLPAEGETAPINYIKVTSRFLPPVNSSNVLIRKEIIKAAGAFNTGQQKHEDHDLWLRLAFENPVVFVNSELSFYRKENRQSTEDHYTASDFIMYLKTLQKVSENISEANKNYYNKYVKRFVTLTFLKYNRKYDHKERKAVYTEIKKLLPRGRLFWLDHITALNFNVYPVLKFFRG